MAAGQSNTRLMRPMHRLAAAATCLLLLPSTTQAARCLDWSVLGADGSHSSRVPLKMNDRKVCGMAGSQGLETCTAEGSCALGGEVKDIGFVDENKCVNDHSAETLSFVGTVDPDCNTRWRFLTYDVWPIGSVIISGKTENGHNFGVCRCPKDEDKEVFDIGKLYLSGPNMGACVCPQSEGKDKIMIGEYEYLQADEGKGHLFDDVASNSNTDVAMADEELMPAVKQLISRHLTSEDKEMLENITNTPVSTLEKELMEQPPHFLRKILSHERYVPHPTLNNMGLHLLRCILAERVADDRRRKRGYHLHPDYESFMQNGILVKNFTELSDQDIRGIMAMVSGLDMEELPPLKWVDRPVKHIAGDAQYEMHMDTFHAAYKIWIYQNETTEDQGPLNFVRGSHRNTKGKLGWLYRVSIPPATHVLREPSVRLNEDETLLGFNRREVMTTPAQSFVIADTSAFHARGLAEPGTIRNAMRIEGPYDGGLPRKNPFFE